MSKKKKNSSHKAPTSAGKASGAAVQDREAARKQKTTHYSGIIIGVLVGLIVFSFSGTSNSTVKWKEGTGVIVDTYTITEAENEEEAGIYADIEFVDSTGATRTERSRPLETDMAGSEGKTYEIKYNPNGEGVLVVGNEVKNSLSITQIIFIVAAIFVIYKISDVIKKSLPTPEEYAARKKNKA